MFVFSMRSVDKSVVSEFRSLVFSVLVQFCDFDFGILKLIERGLISTRIWVELRFLSLYCVGRDFWLWLLAESC